MPRDPKLLTRRRFLELLGLGAGAAVMAACTPAASALPTLSPSPTAAPPSPSPSAVPTASPTPGPSTRDKIGQMLLVGFRGLSVAQATSIVADIGERNLGGILLFDKDLPTHSDVRNIASPDQLAALVRGLQAKAATPLLVAVDEEGGLVARLDQRHGFPATYSAAQLGARNDPVFTREQGRRIAQTLDAAGINLNLAPVVDLDVSPDNPIIGALDRSFGADPAKVAAQAEAFVAGHHDVGIGTTLKHFPGHGSSTGDTHLGVVDVTATWKPVELQPFARLISDGVADAVLTAHVFNRALDAEHPATLSNAIVSGMLRDQLGWDGVVISDDMQMGAIRKVYGYADAVRLAILAGVDVLTIAQQQVFEEGIVARTIEIIAGLVEDGTISAERIDASYRRITALKARIARA